MASAGGPTGSRPGLDLLQRGFDRLRRGSLLTIIGDALGLGALATGLATVPGILHGLGGLLAITSITLLLAFLAVVLAIGGFILTLASTRSFKDYAPYMLGRGYTAAKLILAGFVMFAFGLIILIISVGVESSVGTALTVFGAVLLGVAVVTLFVGIIFFSLFIMDLDKLTLDGLKLGEGFRTAGIMLLVAAILGIIPILTIIGSILGMVSWILVYKYSGDSLEKLASPPRVGPATQPTA